MVQQTPKTNFWATVYVRLHLIKLMKIQIFQKYEGSKLCAVAVS